MRKWNLRLKQCVNVFLECVNKLSRVLAWTEDSFELNSWITKLYYQSHVIGLSSAFISFQFSHPRACHRPTIDDNHHSSIIIHCKFHCDDLWLCDKRPFAKWCHKRHIKCPSIAFMATRWHHKNWRRVEVKGWKIEFLIIFEVISKIYWVAWSIQ